MLRNMAYLLAHRLLFQAGSEQGLSRSLLAKPAREIVKFEVADILSKVKQKETAIPTGEHPTTTKLNQDWLNMVQLNRVLYQAVVSENPRQIATVSYNESKERFLYRMYRPEDSTTIEKRFDGAEI